MTTKDEALRLVHEVIARAMDVQACAHPMTNETECKRTAQRLRAATGRLLRTMTGERFSFDELDDATNYYR